MSPCWTPGQPVAASQEITTRFSGTARILAPFGTFPFSFGVSRSFAFVSSGPAITCFFLLNR